MNRRITLLGVPIDLMTRKESAEYFVSLISRTGQFFTATPNAEMLLEAQKNKDLKNYLQACSLNTPDAVSLQWASMVQKEKWSLPRAILELLFLPIRKSTWKKYIKEQVCGSDLIFDICEEAKKQEKKIFLMGALGDTAERTKTILEKQYPNLNIVRAVAGSPQEEDDTEMLNIINEAQPDILFLAYGCPAQELWIQRNLQKCETVKVAMGIGGTFDFIAGNIKRAPKLFRSLGLEWFWRLIVQPSRWRRIFNAVLVFPYKFLKSL